MLRCEALSKSFDGVHALVNAHFHFQNSGIVDRIIVMDERKVIAQGPPREVLERPKIMEAYLA